MTFRLCHIDTDNSLCDAELPQWNIRIIRDRANYGCAWILMIHLGTRIVEIASGKGK